MKVLKPWKNCFYVVVLQKTKKSQVPILHRFCVTIWSHFGMAFGTLFHDFPYFFGTDFRTYFWMCVFQAFGTKLAPKWLPKSTKKFKKNENVANHSSRGCLASVLTPFWINVGRRLGRFGHLLVTIWEHFGKNHLLETTCNLYQRNIWQCRRHSNFLQ